MIGKFVFAGQLKVTVLKFKNLGILITLVQFFASEFYGNLFLNQANI